MKITAFSRNRYSLVILLSCFSLQAVGIGIYIAFGVFITPMIDEFGWSRAAISGASAMAFFLAGLFGVGVGRLNDRMGPRILVAVGAVFFSAGLMMMAVMNNLWELYLFLGVVIGFGLSPVDVIALTTIARWFPENRGMMTGITKVGTGTGQLVFPLLASFLITGYGWRTACIIIGGVAFVLMMIIALLLKKEPDDNQEITPDGDHQKSLDAQTGNDDNSLTLTQASKTVQFWLICLVNFTVLTCLMSVMIHIVPHARDIGISSHKAAGVLSTIGGVSMAGRFITGFIIDKIGSRQTMKIAIGILIAGILWLQVADRLWQLYLFAFVYGFAHGGYFTVISPIVAEFFGTVSHGALFGIVVFFGNAGGAIGPIATGYLFDNTGSYQTPILLALAVSVAGIVQLLFLKPVIGQNQK